MQLQQSLNTHFKKSELFFNQKPKAVNTVSFQAQPDDSKRHVTVNAMAPLEIKTEKEWAKFAKDLKIAKKYGVESISVDVWWGKVEKKDNKFDWKYYEKVFDTIKDNGLKIVPILAFHKCGGNVGDDVNIPVPEFAWEYLAKKKHIPYNGEETKQKLEYKSEFAKFSDDVIPIWHDKEIMPQYKQFMQAFENYFGKKYGKDIAELNISLGTAGELRYPSYGPESLGATSPYPQRGVFVGYSKAGTKSFQDFVKKKYKTINNVNKAWHISYLESFDDIKVPHNSNEKVGLAYGFVKNHDYEDTQYGRDLTRWYNGTLIKHRKKMLLKAHKIFDKGPLAGIDLGFKVSGIHWKMGKNKIGDTPDARITEIAAGLMHTDHDINSPETDYGYKDILNMAADLNKEIPNRKIITHFTCLEKNNKIDDGVPNADSRAKDLVYAMLKGAQKRGIPIKGENARDDGIDDEQGWMNIREAIKKGYDGITFLRVDNIAREDQTSGKGFKDFASWIYKTYKSKKEDRPLSE